MRKEARSLEHRGEQPELAPKSNKARGQCLGWLKAKTDLHLDKDLRVSESFKFL